MARVRDLWHDARTGQRTSRYGTGMRWQAEWSADGSTRTRSFARKADAERHLAVTVTAVLSGSYVDPRSGRLTVKAYAEEWRAQQLHLRPATRRRHRSQLEQHVYPAMGSLPIGQVRRSTVQAFVAALGANGLAPSTVRMIYRTLLVAVFNAAVRDQVIPVSPCREINLPEAGRSELALMTGAQVLALAAALPARYGVLAELGAASGLRPSELLGLEVDPARGLDFLRRQVRVSQQLASTAGELYLGPPKTAASERVVPLAGETVDRLAAHVAAFPPAEVELVDRTGSAPVRRTARLLLSDQAGRPVRSNRLSDAWRAAVAAVPADVRPVGRVTPHGLRHTYASLLISAGVHAKVIQERLGHSTITETMDTYGHLFDGQADDATRAAIGGALYPRRNDNGTDAPVTGPHQGG